MRGRIVTSGAFLGGRVELDLLRLYSRSQRIIGVRSGNLRSARRLWDAVADGFRPLVDRAYPISRAAEAHRYLRGQRQHRPRRAHDGRQRLERLKRLKEQP